MTASRWFSKVPILMLFDLDSIEERVGLMTCYIEFKVAPDDGVRIDEVSEKDDDFSAIGSRSRRRVIIGCKLGIACTSTIGSLL